MRSFLHRRVLGWIAAAALLLTAGWLLWPTRVEPFFRGRPVRSYFAPWQRLPPGGNPGPPAGLASGLTADSVPVLIEAMSRVDSQAHVQAIRLWLRTPRWLRERLPAPVPAGDVRFVAFQTLTAAMTNSSAERPINRAVARLYARIPATFRVDLLRALGSDPSAGDAVEPLLLEVLRGTNAVEQMAAVDALFGIGAASPNRLDALIACLAPLSEKSQTFPLAWPGVCRELGRLGPAAGAALPWLRKLADHSLPEVRAEAALACWRIAPGGESAGAFLERQLARLGTRGKFVLVSAWFDEAAALGVPAAEAVPVLSRLMEQGAKAGWSTGVRPPTEAVLFISGDQHATPRRIAYPTGYPDLLVRALACDLAGRYGVAARSLEPELHRAAQHADPDVRDAARRALLKIKAESPTQDR